MNLFKDYTGFRVDKFKEYSAVKIKDNKNEYNGIYLIHSVSPFELTLINSKGLSVKIDVDNFTDNFGEYAPHTRMDIEIIG